jgi:ferredoxin-NADP reductase
MEKIKLIKRIKRTPTIESFRFLAEKKIEFIPGQFSQIIFDIDNLENRELNKYLSFSCSPTKEYIEFTKRLSESKFSQKLKNLKIEDTVFISSPLGNCVFDEKYKKIIFLIGGIGITPVISILEYIVDNKIDADTYLFYSNRREEEIAFKDELDSWCKINPSIKVFYLITDCVPKEKDCIYGFINKDLLKEKVKDLEERVIFTFGPPKMVKAMRQLSKELGCKEENIKAENFVGY